MGIVSSKQTGEDHDSSLQQKVSNNYINGSAWNTTLWYESEASFINMKSHMMHKNYLKEFQSYSDMGRSNGSGLTDIFKYDEEKTKCKKNRQVTYELPKQSYSYGGKKTPKSGQYLSAMDVPNVVSEREIKDINSNAIYNAKMESKDIKACRSYTVIEMPLENACNIKQLISEKKHQPTQMDHVNLRQLTALNALNSELFVDLKEKHVPQDHIEIEIEDNPYPQDQIEIGELCKEIANVDNPYSQNHIVIEIEELCKDLTAEDNPYRMRKAYYYL